MASSFTIALVTAAVGFAAALEAAASELRVVLCPSNSMDLVALLSVLSVLSVSGMFERVRVATLVKVGAETVVAPKPRRVVVRAGVLSVDVGSARLVCGGWEGAAEGGSSLSVVVVPAVVSSVGVRVTSSTVDAKVWDGSVVVALDMSVVELVCATILGAPVVGDNVVVDVGFVVAEEVRETDVGLDSMSLAIDDDCVSAIGGSVVVGGRVEGVVMAAFGDDVVGRVVAVIASVLNATVDGADEVGGWADRAEVPGTEVAEAFAVGFAVGGRVGEDEPAAKQSSGLVTRALRVKELYSRSKALVL